MLNELAVDFIGFLSVKWWPILKLLKHSKSMQLLVQIGKVVSELPSITQRYHALTLI